MLDNSIKGNKTTTEERNIRRKYNIIIKECGKVENSQKALILFRLRDLQPVEKSVEIFFMGIWILERLAFLARWLVFRGEMIFNLWKSICK